VFEEADSGMYGGIFSGSGNLIKQGAGFIEFLNDSSDFTGNVAINEGGLIVTGKLGGLCSVSPNTWIKGTGTLGNDVTNHGIVNEGSVQPGGSIGTLTVNGNYTQADTGELVIEINQSGATDLLQVTGTATLNGLLHISPEPGTYLDSTIYTFLTAGNVTGQFTEVISDIPLNYTVNYFPDKAQLFILGSNITIPPPEGREGIITDHIIKITEVDDPEIKNVIGTLITLPPNKYIKTLNKLTPSQFGGFALNELENNFNVANAFFTRGVDQRSCCYVDACQSTNIWFNPLGSIYSQKSRRGTGFTSHVYGITVGVDHLFDNNWNLGFGLGYSYSHLHWKRNEGEAQANSGYLGPYIKYDCDHFYFNCLLLGAGNFYDTNRKVMFSEFSRIAYSNSTDWDFSEVILAGFKLEPCYNFFVQPEFLLDQCNVFQKSFKESGAGSVNLSVKKKYASFLRSLVNLKLIKEWVCSNTCIIPSINVGWLRTTPLSGRHYKAHFRDRSVYAPNFSTTSFSKVIDQVFAGAQVLFSSQEGLAFSVSYDGKFGGGAKVSEINVALHSSF
jgi:outer membrane autotransporter protein